MPRGLFVVGSGDGRQTPGVILGRAFFGVSAPVPRCPALPLRGWVRFSAPSVLDLVQPSGADSGRVRELLPWHTAAHNVADHAAPGGVLPLQLGTSRCACLGHRTY